MLHLPIADGADEQQVCQTIARRIDRARGAYTRGGCDEATATIVAPAGRTASQWVRDLRQLLTARTYRQLALDEERLWGVVEDPAASARARAGAALALAGRGDCAGRIRVAAEDCAEPTLRNALVRIAEGAGEEETEEAIAPLVVQGSRAG
jgi:hypothetical protein